MKKRSFQLLAISLSLVGSLTLLEVAARTYSWWIGRGFWSRPHSFESAFFVTYDWPPPVIEGDVARFKDGEVVPRLKPPGEVRVISAGGSTTLNDQNPEGVRYTRLLEERFRGRLSPLHVRMLNAGADAFSTAHTLVNFSLRLLEFEPDVLTVLHNINDLTVRNFGDHLLPDYSNKYLSDTFLAFEHRVGPGGALLRLSRGLQLLRWNSDLLRSALERSFRTDTVHDTETARRLFRRNLDSIIALARQHDVKVILITMGHRYGDTGPFGEYNEEIRRCGRANGVPVVDAGAAISGRPELFLDDVHMTAAGVRALADLIEPVLEATLREIVSGPAHTP